jgi:hypothetical protein
MMLLVGTAKGLFRFSRDTADEPWQIDGPHLAGYAVLHTLEAPDGRLFAATSHKIWGAHIYTSEDRGASWSTSVVQRPRCDEGHLVPGAGAGRVVCGYRPGRAVPQRRRRQELAAGRRPQRAPDPLDLGAVEGMFCGAFYLCRCPAARQHRRRRLGRRRLSQ